MVLPYVLTQTLKDRVGRKLYKQMSDQISMHQPT